MVPVISFIGWHNSGKTTFVKDVVSHLKQMNLRVAVIKSTKHTDISFDHEGTDTDQYKKAGADSVTLMAPDQMVMMTDSSDNDLIEIIHKYYLDYDIVIGEGFKDERKIAKIEVTRDETELLKDQVSGVIAVVTDRPVTGDYIFKPNESKEVADFLYKRFIETKNTDEDQAFLLVNGKKIPLKGFVQDALAGTVHGFVKTLKKADNIREIDLKIKISSE